MASDRQSIPLDRLQRAVSKLRPSEREVLILSAREGLSNAEIAERLGITSGAAERLLADAIYRLDRALERQEQPWWRFW